MESTRSDRAKIFSETHANVRHKAGKSQEYMAMELGVSKRTVQNWEKGISSPTFFQSLEWFRILNVNPFPYYLSIVYPNSLKGLKGSDSDEKIAEAFEVLQNNLPTSAKRALLFLFYGNHGSSPNAVIQLLLAHLHTPLRSRLPQAVLTAQMFELESEIGNINCEDNIMPNMDVLNDAIRRARSSAVNHDFGYNNIEE